MPINCSACGTELGKFVFHYTGVPMHIDIFCNDCYSVPVIEFDEQFIEKFPAVIWDQELQKYMKLLKKKNES